MIILFTFIVTHISSYFKTMQIKVIGKQVKN